MPSSYPGPRSRRLLTVVAAVGALAAGLITAQAPAAASVPVRAAGAAADQPLPYGPDTCRNGFVWREAVPADHVCVVPATRQATRDENAQAASRREPNGGAYGPNTCRPGFVWREAYDGDVVCVPPDRRTQARQDNAAGAGRRVLSAGDPRSPGDHTVVLDVDRARADQNDRSYACRLNGTPNPNGFLVGWDQYELDGGDPCGAEIVETALHFGQGPLDRVPEKYVTRAVLTYDEAPADGCFVFYSIVGGNYVGILPGSTPGNGSHCWRSGGGGAENKPNGCVSVIGFPTVDWANTRPKGLLPHLTYPNLIRRNGPRTWDVTAPYAAQYERTAVGLGVAGPPPFGMLLRGSVTSFANLTGEDRTSCGSLLSNIHLTVTYTVPRPGPPPVVR